MDGPSSIGLALASPGRPGVSNSSKPSFAHKTLRITVADTLQSFDVATFDGLDATALKFAVAARARVQDFYLTASTDKAGAVIPLSPALADGTALVLHRVVSVEPYTAPSPSPAQHNNGNSSAPAATGLMLPLLPEGAPASDASSAAPAAAATNRSSSFGLFGNRRSQSFGTAAQREQLEGLERLSRLTTDLANERTLLAWTRTCLAAIRTCFTYLSLTATEAAWRGVITATEIGMATLVVATAAIGAWRYFKIKDVLAQKLPPREFGRFSMRPLVALIFITAIATTTGVCSQQWEHAHTPVD